MIFTVAIDGPAAAGKGTLAKAVAARFGLAHLDTGLLYRAVGALGGDPVMAAQTLGPQDLARGDLRSLEAGQAASRVAAIPQVRAALVEFQRRFARQPGGAVLDGRDIGTVIWPEAEVKLYVTANPQVRAHRRWLECGGDPAEVLAAVVERDARDMGRADAPLQAARDAVVIDTSVMGIDEAVSVAFGVVASALAATGPQLRLDAAAWQHEAEVWDAICTVLQAPDWHGRNLDALYDSVTGGLNGVDPPFHLTIAGSGMASPLVSALLLRIGRVFADARRQGVAVEMTLEGA